MFTYLVIGAAFFGVAALVGGISLLLRGDRGSAVEERLDVLTGVANPIKDSKKNEPKLLAGAMDDTKGFTEAIFSRITSLRSFFEQADSPLSPPMILLVSGVLGGIGFVSSFFMNLPVFLMPLPALTLATLPFLWLWWKRRNRLKAFTRQLPDALELIGRALRAGHSLGSGFQLVAQEMSDPIGKEFSRCYDEQNFGIPLDQALEDMTDRVPNLDLRFFATAVILQRQTGGDLAEILDKIGYLIRERFKIWGQIQALTGEGRISGVVLLGLPPVLMAVMYRMNPEYLMPLFTDPLGHKMLAVACVMMLVGALVIRKIVNIKV